MDVAPLPTVAELREWMRQPDSALELAEKVAAPAWDLRQAVSRIYTSVPVGVWFHPQATKAAVDMFHEPTPQDLALVKAAAGQVYDTISFPRRIDPFAEGYVKVAFSPTLWIKSALSETLRTAGEGLGFFPGQYPIPHQSSVYGSMLASGLVGAGLGYGAGWLGETLMPEKWERGKLRKTLGVIGGLAGVAPSMAWGIANKSMGRPFGDNVLLNYQRGEAPVQHYPDSLIKETSQLGGPFKTVVAAYGARDLQQIKVAFDTFSNARAKPRDLGPLDINVDALGRTLWQSGAEPMTAGMTMGALAAAAQMPGGDEDSGPGWVTPM